MHILFLCNEYPPYPHGGIGTFIQTIARRLVKNGHNATVVGIYRNPTSDGENDQGVEVFRLAAKLMPVLNPLINGVILSRKIYEIQKKHPIDIIEGNELSFCFFWVRLPIPKIIRIAGGHTFFSISLNSKVRKFTFIAEKCSFRKADNLCAVSKFAAETTRQVLHLRDRKIEILPNPVDVNLFHPMDDIKENKNLIVFTGGLREKKGIKQLIQAMPIVLEKFPDAQLWIQGQDFIIKGTGRSIIEELRSLIPQSYYSQIHFRGAVPHDQLPEINCRASVLVYPSWMETQGIVVIEGMASGRAVIASETGPGPELIDDGVNGLLCNPYSPGSIAEKIILLLHDRELRKRLGENARNKVLDKFSVENMVNENIHFYQSCLNQNRS